MTVENSTLILAIYIAIECLLFFLSVVGNFLVIFAIVSSGKYGKASNQCIINVAIADFLFGLIAIPSAIPKAIDDMPHDFNLCLWVSSLVIFCYGASMQALVMMSVDRFWAIYFPFSYHSRSRKSIVIILIISWLPAVFDGGLPLFGWNRKDEFKGRCIVTLIMDTQKSILSSSYIFISLIAMILMYTMIYIAIVRQRKLHQSFSSVESSNSSGCRISKLRQKEINIATTFAWIVFMYFICYMPLNINLMIVEVTKNPNYFQTNVYLRTFHIFSICIAHVNSAINVFIYAYKIKDIRDRIKKIVCCSRK